MTGTTIYDALQYETGARPGRKVQIINLGLDPEEAVAMGLEIEKAEQSGRKKGVASYINPKWERWLQENSFFTKKLTKRQTKISR